MTNIGVVILNYLAYETTIDTVKSFLAQNAEGYRVEIVIVDNCSPNESYDKLCKVFKDVPNVTTFKTDSNLGFAKGNNYGYKKLLDILTPDFVIISNDDILLPQEGLYKWISESYNKYAFAVLGPDIYSINGNFHQSPIDNYTRSLMKCRYRYLKNTILILKLELMKRLNLQQQYETPKWENFNYDKPTSEYTLHGSFQIFSHKYFECYDDPYDNHTFLYMEEDILKLRCDQLGLKMIYDNSYLIQHLQAVSTNMVHTDNADKLLFRKKNLNRSLLEYMIILKDREKK